MSDLFQYGDDVRRLDISVEQWYRLSREGMNATVTFSLNGESMRPLIRKKKDKVTVSPVNRELKKGDIVLFTRSDGVYVVHRIRKIKESVVTTVGDNCTVSDKPMPAESVLGLVIRLERNGKAFNLDSSLSRVFGLLLIYTRHVRCFLRRAVRFVIGAAKKSGD